MGRRIGKKQAAPEAMTDMEFANMKRKAGLPADPVADTPQNKRRRMARQQDDKGDRKINQKKEAGVDAGNKVKKMNVADAGRTPKKAKAQPAKVVEEVAEPSDEEEEDSDMSVAALGDDFLGSDSDSDVYNSADDEAGPGGKVHVFSEDEDDSDFEEKLTAANIAGLSQKLDDETAKEEADVEADLKESALQTNIAGEGLGISDDEDDDNQAIRSKTLLAPDLQLLRTRVNDNIRVLENFATMCEPGRSRTDYTTQLLRD
ncbi:hypothetical protein IMZ48_01880, partial [Candidatus Bathyarchaeota archaeon]|nr:hypothetical protein [Candidatus Bathyarchaeota archaeon]